MNYLLDTCLLSELCKLRPNTGVIDWIMGTDESRLFVSALSLSEIQKGIAKLETGKRKSSIQTWLDQDLLQRFNGKILSVNLDTALEWGLFCGKSESKGRPVPVIDSLLAVTAIVHNLCVVTRNEGDFEPFPVKILNPWE